MYGFGKDEREGGRYEIVGFLTAINLEDDEGDNLGVALALRQLNQTYYQYTFTVPSTTRLYFASFYRLIFNTNLPSSTPRIIITSVSQTYTPSNRSPSFPDSIQLPFSSLMIGLSGVEFPKQPNVSFAFEGNGSVSGEYNVVTLNVVEFKGYSCPGGSPYYYHGTGSCYEKCPAGTYTEGRDIMVCGKCHAECRTCDGGSNKSCLSCYDEDKIEVLGQGKSCVKGGCDPQCLTCSEGGESPPVCTSCDASAGLLLKSGSCVCQLPTQVYDPSENLCVDCSTLHASPCLTCTLSACLTCKQNSTMSVGTPGTCVCDANFVFSPASATCLPCTSIPRCLTCHNLSACARCQPSMLLINSQCFCPLASQFFNPELSKCSNCRSSCATCLSETQCLTCRPEKNTVLNANHQCVCPINHAMSPTLAICVRTKCPPGFILAPSPATPDPSNTTINCQEICGDGKLFELECDDGNLEDGDGCSAQCEIEEGYQCVNGTEWSPSVCGWSGEVRFEFVGREEGAMVFRVDPPGLKGMERVDFAGGIRLVGGDGKKKESIRGVTAEYEDGLLRLMMAEDWEGAGNNQDVVTLEFTAPPGAPTLFAIRPSPLAFPPPVTSPLLRSFSSTISTVFSCTTVVSLVLLFLPAPLLPVLSLFSLLQTTYIAQFLPSTLAPLYLPYLSHPATKPLTLGPNFLPEHLETVSFQGVVEYSRYFIGNINLMTVAQIVMMVLGYVLGGWRVGRWMKGEGVERLVGYGVINVGFCLGLEVLGWGTARGGEVGTGVEIGNILWVVVTIILNVWILSRSPRRSRQTTIFLAFRFLTSFLLSLFLHSPHTPLFLLLLHYLYLTYLLLSSPSFEAAMRNAAVELTLIFQLSVVYAFSGDLRPTSKQLIGVGMVHMVLVLFCAVYCGYCVCGGEGGEKEGGKGVEAIRGGSVISSVSGRGSQGGLTGEGDGEGRVRGQGEGYEIEEPKDSMQFFDIEEPAKDEIQ